MRKFLHPLLIALLSTFAHAEAPHIDPAQDSKHFGIPGEIFSWTTAQKIAGFRNQDLLYPVRAVPSGEQVTPLPYDLQDLGDITFEHGDDQLTIDDYFRDYNTAGLLVIKDGVIRYERYGLGNTAQTRWHSWSIAKSVTSMLLGAAIQDGFIDSVDEIVTDYLPELKGSAYEGVSIRNILQMSSGVEWDETYADPDSDINTVEWTTAALYKHLSDKKRVADPGRKFNYSTAETNLAGNLVGAAVGDNLSNYLSEKIWRPFGMEQDAYWQLVAPEAEEYGGSSLGATLRDYGRLGLFALGGGSLPGDRQVLPENWMTESTRPSSVNRKYGYQWWLGLNGVYRAMGIFGQTISIDPDNGVVIAQHSAREQPAREEDWIVQAAAFRAITEALKR